MVNHIRQRWKRFYRLITVIILKPDCEEVNLLESVIVSIILNKHSLHSFTLFSYFPFKGKGQLKIDHQTLTDLIYLET